MTFWERQNYKDIKQVNGCSCLREGEYLTSKGLHEGVSRAVQLLSMMLCWWIHESRHSSKPTKLSLSKNRFYCLQTKKKKKEKINQPVLGS